MKGSDCRLNLIKLTNCFYNKCETAMGRRIYKMLLPLVEMQQMIYAEESQRTAKSILRLYNQTFLFSVYFHELFAGNEVKKPRALFGMSHHAIISHLPDLMRRINGRSIVAEQAERHFNKLRQVSLHTVSLDMWNYNVNLKTVT